MIYTIVLLIFFISGALGLGYQILWSKYLLDFIGVSAYSYATVLAAFMAGLATGSWFFGKWADRKSSALKLYAFLELGIGAYALLYPTLLSVATEYYGKWMNFTPDQAGAGYGLWIKILVSGILLLPPTFLMGGTYPALVRYATENLNVLGRRASQLYAANALGAVLGTLGMTFLLMPALGMASSLMLLAIVNGVIAVAVLLVSWISRRSIMSSEEIRFTGHNLTLSPWQMRLGILLIFLEGLIAFSFEIAWTRYFGVVLGSSTQSFSIMLAAFITGIALGSYWLSRVDSHITNPVRFLGWAQIIAATLVLLTLPMYPYIPWLFEQYASLLSVRPAAFYLYEFGKLFFCYLIMLPPTIFIGMVLPLAVKGLSLTLAHLGKDTGRIYSANTWGNVTGALLAGLFLLPVLGMERLLHWNAAVIFLLGLVAVTCYAPQQPLRPLRKTILTGVFFLFLLIYGFLFGSWDRSWFSLFAFRRSQVTQSFQDAKNLLAQREIVLFEDDPAAHLMVKKDLVPTAEGMSLYVNGKAEASNNDIPSEILLAQVPLLLHPNPQNVLVIGLGAGVTTGSALTHTIDRIDVVDIVRLMPKATRLFASTNNHALGDPRFHFIGDDARNYVSYTRQKYDVIISQPSNPWTAGTGSLFSRDFYKRAARALRPDGLYLQWFQAYEVSDDTFVAVVRTFRRVFPFVYVFQGGASDALLLGSYHDIRPDWSAVLKRFDQASVRKELQRASIQDLSAFLSLQRFSPSTVESLAATTELENTDDNHFLEYKGPRDLFQGLRPESLERMDERLRSSPSLFWSQFVHHAGRNVDLFSTLQLLGNRQIGTPSLLRAYQIAYYYLNDSSFALLPPPALSFFPESIAIQTPLTETTLVERITSFLKEKRQRLAISLLDSFSSSILIECVLSSDKARFWTAQVKEWLRLPLEPGSQFKFRAFHIDLLTATNQTESAAAELLKWVKEESPPSAEWALLRSARIDRLNLEPVVLEIYLKREPSPFLHRLVELQK